MIGAIILATALWKMPATPLIGRQCFSSPLFLATDNAPLNNEISTSVVNIWAFIGPPVDPRPVAWLYKNASGKFYIQFRGPELPSYHSALPFAEKLFARAKNSPTFFPIVPVNIAQIFMLENTLGQHGIVRESCFLNDYQLKGR